MLFDLDSLSLTLTILIFIWTGFVRTGIGFGGAALGLPLMLLIVDQPLFWLPMIGIHLLFFSSLTLGSRLNAIDWGYLGKSTPYIVPAALVGVIGLINLPTQWMVLLIFCVSLFYGMLWLLNLDIRSSNRWVDRALLMLGGYIAGTSLTGAPIMVAVFARNVTIEKLRNTLFILWIILVLMKMSTFIALGVDIQFTNALLLLPAAAIGHFAGLKTHEKLVQNGVLFRRVVGGVLVAISLAGIIR